MLFTTLQILKNGWVNVFNVCDMKHKGRAPQVTRRLEQDKALGFSNTLTWGSSCSFKHGVR